jgi:hypothetical protein
MVSLPLVIPENASGLVWESEHGDADVHRSARLCGRSGAGHRVAPVADEQFGEIRALGCEP